MEATSFIKSLHAEKYFMVRYNNFVICGLISKPTQKSYRTTIRVSNSLEPDQAQHFVRETVCKGYQEITLAGEELIGRHVGRYY